ncbi:MAG: Maf family protein [Candidatus Krumholzibacteria bacterium]|nr:Maf family protein [Candidatus Krumholzibacteria bacterium]MDP6668798.1 Maf family protein [Candidatus Krumholzibacteria bacterium]MDP6797918.1 Maf family protein [Candidatus Krumholzibacteria bacterium]MDP7021750.1 Maf family protein [Candidatus Krumholzibacteria bacterium]
MNPFLPEDLQTRLLLASASPRRRELLARIGLEPPVLVSDYDETPLEGESADEASRRHALGKARDVSLRFPDKLVIAADTLVLLDGEILGKPCDAGEAAGMLRFLSDRKHEVLTALALREGEREEVQVATSQVRFRALEGREIAAYLETGESFDKAGSYGVQGLASSFVEGIEGCFFNVMGLPLELLTRMLKAW